MSDEDSTPPPAETDTIPPDSAAASDKRRRRLEGVIPEIVRRAVELGVEKATEAPDNLKQFVGDMKLPKDIAHYLFNQIDETKNGLFRVVAKEIRDFLEHTNFAGEMQKLLTTVQFEVNTTIRFTPNDGRTKRGTEPPPSADKADKADKDKSDRGDKDKSDAETAAEGERRPTPLPRPEVKTNVHVRREGPKSS